MQGARLTRPCDTRADGTRVACVGSALYIVSPQGFVSLLCGHPDVAGFEDGQGIDARFDMPCALTMDHQGVLFVTDQNNHSIRKVTRDGAVRTLAGNGQAGFVDAEGEEARFEKPAGIALDAAGDFIVADSLNHAVRKVTPLGLVSTLAGNGQSGFVDGLGHEALFNQPAAVALDQQGLLLLADDNNHAIRLVHPDGRVATVAGNGQRGCCDGEGAEALFNGPEGIVVDSNNVILVADFSNHCIRKIVNGHVSTLAGGPDAGAADGEGAVARFSMPRTLFLDERGRLFVSEEDRRGLCRVVEACLAPPLWLGPAGVAASGSDSASSNVSMIHVQVHADLLAMVENGMLADVLFEVQGEQLPGHRAILAARSEYFRGLFAGTMSEAKAHHVAYPDIPVDDFRVLLRFFYSGQLPDLDPRSRVAECTAPRALELSGGDGVDAEGSEGQGRAEEGAGTAKSLMKLADRFQVGLCAHVCIVQVGRCAQADVFDDARRSFHGVLYYAVQCLYGCMNVRMSRTHTARSENIKTHTLCDTGDWAPSALLEGVPTAVDCCLCRRPTGVKFFILIYSCCQYNTIFCCGWRGYDMMR